MSLALGSLLASFLSKMVLSRLFSIATMTRIEYLREKYKE